MDEIELIYTVKEKDSFIESAIRAQIIAEQLNEKVKFIYNGIVCFVDSRTRTNLLERDYNTAVLLDWEIIGPHCVEEYDDKLNARIIEKLAKIDQIETSVTIKHIFEELDSLRKTLNDLRKSHYELHSRYLNTSTDVWLIKNEMRNQDIVAKKEAESKKYRFWLWD